MSHLPLQHFDQKLTIVTGHVCASLGWCHSWPCLLRRHPGFLSSTIDQRYQPLPSSPPLPAAHHPTKHRSSAGPSAHALLDWEYGGGAGDGRRGHAHPPRGHLPGVQVPKVQLTHAPAPAGDGGEAAAGALRVPSVPRSLHGPSGIQRPGRALALRLGQARGGREACTSCVETGRAWRGEEGDVG